MYNSEKYLENARRNARYLPEKLKELESLREKRNPKIPNLKT